MPQTRFVLRKALELNKKVGGSAGLAASRLPLATRQRRPASGALARLVPRWRLVILFQRGRNFPPARLPGIPAGGGGGQQGGPPRGALRLGDRPDL